MIYDKNFIVTVHSLSIVSSNIFYKQILLIINFSKIITIRKIIFFYFNISINFFFLIMKCSKIDSYEQD